MSSLYNQTFIEAANNIIRDAKDNKRFNSQDLIQEPDNSAAVQEELAKDHLKLDDTHHFYYIKGSNDDSELVYLSNDQIDFLDVLNTPGTDITIVDANKTSADKKYQEYCVTAWDPRLIRLDYFYSKDSSAAAVIPFASNTASSCYHDMVFSVPVGFGKGMLLQANKSQKTRNKETQIAINTAKKAAAKKAKENSSDSTSSTEDGSTKNAEDKTMQQTMDETWDTTSRPNGGIQTPQELISKMTDTAKAYLTSHGYKDANKIPFDEEDYINDPDMYGLSSLMNPYSVTRLLGGISTIAEAQMGSNKYVYASKNRMYDIRDSRRFYDVVNAEKDYISVSNPTTTNIIKWSNSDHWGRTPYSFQDFVFCKWWNKIPNNRLLTLRKYAQPTFDNLNFEGMLEDKVNTKKGKTVSSAGEKASNTKFAPIVTCIGYFGDSTPNKLSSILSFTTGTNWDELKASIYAVDGNEGTNPQQMIDDMFNGKGGFGSAQWAPANKILDFGSIATSKGLSFGKFVNLFDPGGYSATAANADKLMTAQMDPYENGPYANRIKGPLNRIDAVKKRKEGIVWTHSINLKFEYIARPIGGINTKAAMLDIMANCLEMASADAVFWGGGHKFNVHPSAYPWKGTSITNNLMKDLYKGQIFGSNGAIAHTFEGVKKFGTDSNGNFSWDTIAGSLKNLMGEALGGLSSVINTVVSSVFGKSTDIFEKIASGAGASAESVNKGKEKVKFAGNNLNEMFKSKVIKQTIYPSVSGMQALLIGIPVGNWHLTVGNPLNPIIVCGNLICKEVKIAFSDDLGPDDFPTEMSAEFTIEHGMARDKAAIESMFNRGAGKIYKLPDHIIAASDLETKVDKNTGGSAYRYPAFVGPTLYGAVVGKKLYKLDPGSKASNEGNSATTFIPKFTPEDPTYDITFVSPPNSIETRTSQLSKYYAVMSANLQARKSKS